ncbi:MAG: ABC transporter permease [Lachnospiraceae bacterium]|nr:ABC transporter permease [Lachnospiraceae bacterium]
MNCRGKRTRVSPSFILFEFRNITGNPYVHIFGIGMPVLMTVVIAKVMALNLSDESVLSTVVTGIFLGMGAMIPLATILMGYAATYSQELEKGIPQRMELFGISQTMTIIHRIISELIFQICAFAIYFIVGFFILRIQPPMVSGLICYIICIGVLAVISFMLAHAIALFCKKFAIVYCISMMLYFCIMIASGMMGINYEMLPSSVQAISKLLPTTYITKDFADIWLGKEYNFMPMLQAYLFVGTFSGIILFFCLKRNGRKIA